MAFAGRAAAGFCGVLLLNEPTAAADDTDGGRGRRRATDTLCRRRHRLGGPVVSIGGGATRRGSAVLAQRSEASVNRCRTEKSVPSRTRRPPPLRSTAPRGSVWWSWTATLCRTLRAPSTSPGFVRSTAPPAPRSRCGRQSLSRLPSSRSRPRYRGHRPHPRRGARSRPSWWPYWCCSR